MYINGRIPDVISFDHDLGEEKTGYDCVKCLCQSILDCYNDIDLPEILIHSANPVGRENIRQYWDWFSRNYYGGKI